MNTFSEWLDDFFTSYYQHRPVNATFIGAHAHDERLPDFSETGVAALCAEMESLLMRLPAADGLSAAERLDRQLAANFLEIQLAEFRGQHFQCGNPSLYIGEAIFGIIALFLRDYAPLPQHIEAARARLHAIPALLSQGTANVRAAPREWTQKAMRECEGATRFLREGLPLLTPQQAALHEAAQVALRAIAEYEQYLSQELLHHHRAGYACGQPFFDALMQKGHGLTWNGEQVAAYGMERFRELHEQLQQAAHALRDDGDGQQILASLADVHPSAERYLNSFQEIWEDSRRVATEQQLLTWPEYPLRYRFVPEPFRAAAPYLYFLPYRAPAALDPPSVHEYLVPPIDGTLTAAEQTQRLRATNKSVIKLNHVVHHGGIGHHVQNYYAYRAVSRIGRIAAVDCASRIAMFSGGTMAEGWACYATDLMGEANFYTPHEAFAQLHSQLRQAARCVVDANLHLGRFSFAEALDFYHTQVGMAPDAARSEAVKNAMFPGAAVMYLIGTDAIHRLRRDLSAREGTAFTLKNFHDRFLSYGSLPVALIARAMLDEKGGTTQTD